MRSNAGTVVLSSGSMRVLLLLLVVASCDRSDYGERCSDDADCEAELDCVGDVDRYCMPTCAAGEPTCPPDGFVCVGSRDLSPAVCSRVCTSAGDCPGDWECTSIIDTMWCTPRM